MDLESITMKPQTELLDFVESFWMISNKSNKEHQIVILPDGRFDIIFSLSEDKFSSPTLKGLDIMPEQTTIAKNTSLFAVSFKLLAIEYLLNIEVSSLLNQGINLPPGFWGVSKSDLSNFDQFSNKISKELLSQIKPGIDRRKQKLFELIYSSNGTLPIRELSEKAGWRSRQINRYFTQTFGISLKAYCNIFRFKSSLSHLKKGILFPELNFTDQNHFIKEVKRMSGVTPKELSKNQNDRFILLSAMQSD